MPTSAGVFCSTLSRVLSYQPSKCGRWIKHDYQEEKKEKKNKLFNHKQNCHNPFYDWTILKQIRKKKNKQNQQPTKQENIDRNSVKLMSHLQKMTKLTKWKSYKN